jgi:hypothetical protein
MVGRENYELNYGSIEEDSREPTFEDARRLTRIDPDDGARLYLEILDRQGRQE